MAEDPWAAFFKPAGTGAPDDPWKDFQVAPPSKAFDPGMSPMQTARDVPYGFVHGLRDVPAGGAQLLTSGLEELAPKDSWFENYMREQRGKVNAMNVASEAEYEKNKGPSSDVGRVAGNVAATAPIAAAMPGATAANLGVRALSGAGSGAITGLLQPVDPSKDYWSEKAHQAGLGAAGGAVGPIVGTAASRVISPELSPQIKTLMNEGVKLTPGQLLGKTATRFEQGAESIPFLGDAIKAARLRGIESFDRAAINRALDPIGTSLPKGAEMGREAIDTAHKMITTRYDVLLPKLRVQMDPPFVGNMQSLISAANSLDPSMEKVFRATLTDKLVHRFAPGGGMTGNDFKAMESEFGRLAKNYSSSANAGERELGGAFKQVQAELRDMLLRNNPAHAGELGKINEAFANLVRVERAGAMTGAEEGVFTPAHLLNAVKAGDSSARKNAFARGDALMQDLADAGKTVMGSKVPDSGTPYRHIVGLGGLGGLGAVDPATAIGTATGLAGAATAYTRPGRAVMEYLLAHRPPGAQQAASILRLPATAPLGGLLAQQYGQP